MRHDNDCVLTSEMCCSFFFRKPLSGGFNTSFLFEKYSFHVLKDFFLFHQEFDKVMLGSPLYTTTLRQPLDHLRSIFNYFGLTKHIGKNIQFFFGKRMKTFIMLTEKGSTQKEKVVYYFSCEKVVISSSVPLYLRNLR